MDQNKLRTLVFEKTGVKVDSDDPIFALVALNETVLAEAVERHVALIDEAGRRLQRRLRQAQPDGAGRAAADEWEGEPAGLDASGAAAVDTAEPVARTDARPALRPAPLLAGAAGVSLLSALCVVGAQALLARPAPAPAPAAPPALSAEQRARLARAERLEQAIQKLDAKARSRLAAELQKP